MSSSLLCLIVMVAVIVGWFLIFKRPVYEAVLISFLILLTISGKWTEVLTCVWAGISTPLIYTMTAFILMSVVLSKTRIIDSSVAIILSLFGKINGGAGYVTVLASSFMGALSGSGPGNIMVTGSITVPAMKKSGFPPELAANIVSNSSYLGNIIPPSTNIVAALGAYMALYPDSGITSGQFWILLWGISLWFILQRILMVYLFCRHYGIGMPNTEEIPDLKEIVREGAAGLLLPVIIVCPFIIDFFLQDSLIAARLGEAGAKYCSSSILLFIAGVATIYTCFITADKALVTPRSIAKMFSSELKQVVPVVSVCIFGYMIGALFRSLNISQDVESIILAFHLNKLGLCILLCLFTCIMGMVIPGSSLVVLFGPSLITMFSTVGVDPLLAAGMLPCICGVMCGITPPLGLGLYAGMSLAGSEFGKTVRNNMWWIAAQFVLQVIVLMGWLPVFGLQH